MKNTSKTNSKIYCLCPVQTTTMHHIHFLPYGNIKSPIDKLQKPSDIQLISNNWKMNKQQIKSKVWPEIMLPSESYEDFLKRLERCKKQIFDLYFKSPTVDKEIINKIHKNSNKTIYQLVFSPDIFTPRIEKKRFAKLERYPVRMNYEETTYRTYFSRINELQRFKGILQGVTFKENKEVLKNELKQIRHCCRTTYHDEMSAMGKLYAKPTLPGPIDRYTLRKI